MNTLFIIVWRSATGKVWQSERYAPNADGARAQFKRDRSRLATQARILYTKQHDGQRYGKRGQFV